MNISRILQHYIDEGDSAYIYETLEKIAHDSKRKEIFRKLRDKEVEHQQKFAELLQKQNVPLPTYKPSLRIRALRWLAEHGMAESVLKMRIYDESKEIKMYFREAGSHEGVTAAIARDEAIHAKVLQNYLTGVPREIWHQQNSGGILRNVVYGFNDGLTANFGLIMGVIGSAADHRVLLLSGIAGLLADTLSMGSSSYLAAQSEKEVHEHEIAMEKEEIELMPEMEEAELALIYQAKGFDPNLAKEVAHQIMTGNPEKALKEKVNEELGIDPETIKPIEEGLLTGAATFFGAAIPIIPLFFGSTPPFIITSFTISMISHFGVGAIRSLFTGRGVIRSGFDMFLVGLGVAIAGYAIGYTLTGHL